LAVVQENDGAAFDALESPEPSLLSPQEICVVKARIPHYERNPEARESTVKMGSADARGRPKSDGSDADSVESRFCLFDPIAKRLRAAKKISVTMIERMVSDRMSACKDGCYEFGLLLGFFRDEKKRGFRVMARKHVENRGRARLIRPIVEGKIQSLIWPRDSPDAQGVLQTISDRQPRGFSVTRL